jgi:hypothetical protein
VNQRVAEQSEPIDAPVQLKLLSGDDGEQTVGNDQEQDDQNVQGQVGALIRQSPQIKTI